MKKKTQWRESIEANCCAGKNQEFTCSDLPSSHILINIRGVILVSVYNDNSFSWFWLIDQGKEINSFILFYSLSSTLCVIFKLLSWLMCSLHLMAYDNKYIYHTTRTKIDMSCTVFISLCFHYDFLSTYTAQDVHTWLLACKLTYFKLQILLFWKSAGMTFLLHRFLELIW